MATELEELQSLNVKLSEFLTYVKDKDTAAAAAATAAAEQAALDAAAAEQAAAEQAALDAAAAEQAALDVAADEQALQEYRSSVLDALAALDETPVEQADYTALLTEIKTAIEPDAQAAEISHYADLALIFLVIVVLPVWLVYRVYKYVFGMLVRAF